MADDMNCATAIDLMGDALEGSLPPDSEPGFREHLLECGPCGTYFEQLGAVRAALGHLPPSPQAHPRRDELIEEFQRELRDRNA
jgi:hypothetical protein